MKKKYLIGTISIAVIAVLIGTFVVPLFLDDMTHMSMSKKRENFISAKQDIIGTLMAQGNYKCCLEKPCTYCIEKDPKHGEGATCTCLEDVVNGVHPCGECIGEILEGHGNKYLKEYFAPAIAEEVGMQHLDEIEQIINEKYQ